MMPRYLAQPCPLSVYALPAHDVVYGLCSLGITIDVVRGVVLYDAAVSGTAVPTLPLLTACTHCCVCTFVELLDTAVSAPFPDCGFKCTMLRVLARQCPLSRRLVRVYPITH